MSELEHKNSGKVLSDTLPFSEAVQIGNLLFLSGQLGAIPKTLELEADDIEVQTHRMMKNIRLTLEANGSTMENLIRCTVMLKDMSEWHKFNAVYVQYFQKPYPARSAFGGVKLALDARVEMECTALIK